MKVQKMTGILSVMLFAVLMVASAAFALPTIDKVEVDGTTVFENQVNRLSIESGNSIDIDVWLTADEAADSLRVKAEIDGYEHEEDNSLSAKTSAFAVEDNATYRKSLSLTLPSDVEKDSYKLRISIVDKYSDSVVQNYNLVLDSPRHSLVIDDVVFYPEGTVTAGNMLLVTVRLENLGQKDEEDVRVKVSVPELGLSATDYIDEVESDDEEETEEMFLRIPRDTEAGDYTVKVTADYNDGYDTVSGTYTISVAAAPAAPAPVVVEPAEPVAVPEPADKGKSALRSVLEGVLLVLVGILVVIAIIFGVSKLASKDE